MTEIAVQKRQAEAQGLIENPFPGLRPFDLDETHLFFGREGQIDEVLNKLEVNRFCAVLGTSGSGKSSLMYCGLIPSLHGGFMTSAGSNWKVVACRPGVNPIANLGGALTESNVSTETTEAAGIRQKYAETILRGSSTGLIELADQLLNNSGENLLLLVDQFEELFRFSQLGGEGDTMNESAAFVKLLLQAVKQKEVPIYIVMTMRSDFIGDCAQFPALTALINDSHYLIPQMTRENRKLAILGPVAVGEGQITPRLVQQLLNDLGNRTDQLPIMQHALMRTWQFWKQNQQESEPMDIYHYESIGKMSEALSQHANEAFEELSKEQKIICVQVFKTITDKGSDARGVRRPTQLKEIAKVTGYSSAEIIPIINVFRTKGRTFLMPPEGTPLTEDSVIDISHESLMRVWVRCRDWVDEEAESAKIYRRLSEAATLYQMGRTSLWRPPDLTLALNWQNKQKPTLAWAERYNPSFERTMVFLETSKRTYEEEQRSKDRIQKRQIAIIRTVAIVIGFLALVMIFIALWARVQADDAEREAEKARQAEIQATAASERAKQNERLAQEQKKSANEATARAKEAGLKAQEAANEAKEALKQAEQEKARATKALRAAELARTRAESEKLRANSASEEAKENAARAEASAQQAKDALDRAKRLQYLSVAQAMAARSLQVRDTIQRSLIARQAYLFNANYGGDPDQPEIFDGLYSADKWIKGENFNLLKGHQDMVRDLAFDQSGHHLYSIGSDGQLLQWDLDLTTPEPLRLIKTNKLYRTMAISRDEKYLALGSDDSGIDLFDLQNQRVVGTLEGSHAKVWDLIFTFNNKRLISSGADNRIIVWDVATLEPEKEFKTKDPVKAMAMGPFDQSVIGVSSDGMVQSWPLSREGQYSVLHHEEGETGTAIAISPDENYLIKGFASGKVLVYDLLNGRVLTNLEGHNARISSINFSSNGLKFITTSYDRSARIWNMNNLNSSPIVLRDHQDWVTGASFEPNGDMVVTAMANGNLRYFNLNTNEMANELCNPEIVTRDTLSAIEWVKYVGDNLEREVTCE